MEEPQQPKSKKPKGKRSAKKGALVTRQTGKKDKYAYTITDVVFEDFKVLNSANAWWLEKYKVVALLEVYKMDGTDEEACANAGILLSRLRHFRELHPEFLQVKQACKRLPTLVARKCINDSLSKNEAVAWRYLEKKAALEFGRGVGALPEAPDEPETPTGNSISFVDFAEPEDKKEVIKEPNAAESK